MSVLFWMNKKQRNKILKQTLTCKTSAQTMAVWQSHLLSYVEKFVLWWQVFGSIVKCDTPNSANSKICWVWASACTYWQHCQFLCELTEELSCFQLRPEMKNPAFNQLGKCWSNLFSKNDYTGVCIKAQHFVSDSGKTKRVVAGTGTSTSL